MIDYQRIGIFGRTKSGKSTLMDRIIRGHERVILFDHVDERAETAVREGFSEVTDFEVLRDRVDESYSTGFRLWFHPHYRDDLVQHLSNVSDFMLDIQAQFAKDHDIGKRPSVTLAVDELKNGFPNQSQPKGKDGFSFLCSEGRHKGIHLVGATQRPAEVSTRFRGQLEKRFLFNLTEPADLRAVTEMGGMQGKELAEAVRLLKPLEYIRMENGQYASGKLSFPG